ETFKANALAGDLSNASFSPKSFEVCSLISVIQYLQDPMGTLKRVNSLLKKGGLIYIETTNEDALIFKIGDLLKSFGENQKVTTHLSPLFSSFQIYGFNKKSLEKALTTAGFEVIYSKVMRGMSIFAGGKIEGRGIVKILKMIILKITVFLGVLIGKGHVMYCMAIKKER
ncbi:MAG: methyltransferase domain-containing protein, partial [Candidatus Omnitrophica bacterium]|nr:methyltransferase domain-containing protein [Candidatus Omnitrophota bacterium]